MIEILKAEEKHLPGLMMLWKEILDYHTGIEPWVVARADAVQMGESYIRDLMKAPDVLVSVALDNEKIVGYSIGRIAKYPPVWQHEKFGYIDDFGVTTSYRHKGVGEKMLKEMENWFNSKQISRLELYVYAVNGIGNKFWRKNGFVDFNYRLRKEIK